MKSFKSISYHKCGVKYCKNKNSVHSTNKISYFTLPKNSERRAIWIKNCVLTELTDKNGNNKDVRVCQDHFEDKMFLNINRKNRLTDNAVPTLFYNHVLVTSHVLLEHNYSAVPQIIHHHNINLDNCDTTVLNLNTTSKICQKNIHIELPVTEEQLQKKISFCQLNTLDLCLPCNWHTFYSSKKKYFSISEIVFIDKQENVKSFIRKNIILSQSLSITCNVLGISINTNRFVNAAGNIESQKHLEKLIKEVAVLKICKGLDLISNTKFIPFFSVNDSVMYDTMQSKRDSNCLVLISNGLHCTFCKKTIKKINQRRWRTHKSDLQKNYNNK